METLAFEVPIGPIDADRVIRSGFVLYGILAMSVSALVVATGMSLHLDSSLVVGSAAAVGGTISIWATRWLAKVAPMLYRAEEADRRAEVERIYRR